MHSQGPKFKFSPQSRKEIDPSAESTSPGGEPPKDPLPPSISTESTRPAGKQGFIVLYESGGSFNTQNNVDLARKVGLCPVAGASPAAATTAATAAVKSESVAAGSDSAEAGTEAAVVVAGKGAGAGADVAVKKVSPVLEPVAGKGAGAGADVAVKKVSPVLEPQPVAGTEAAVVVAGTGAEKKKSWVKNLVDSGQYVEGKDDGIIKKKLLNNTQLDDGDIKYNKDNFPDDIPVIARIKDPKYFQVHGHGNLKIGDIIKLKRNEVGATHIKYTVTFWNNDFEEQDVDDLSHPTEEDNKFLDNLDIVGGATEVSTAASPPPPQPAAQKTFVGTVMYSGKSDDPDEQEYRENHKKEYVEAANFVVNRGNIIAKDFSENANKLFKDEGGEYKLVAEGTVATVNEEEVGKDFLTIKFKFKAPANKEKSEIEKMFKSNLDRFKLKRNTIAFNDGSPERYLFTHNGLPTSISPIEEEAGGGGSRRKRNKRKRSIKRKPRKRSTKRKSRKTISRKPRKTIKRKSNRVKTRRKRR